MPRTTRFEPGTVVLVRFPFTDLTASKQRPAVVLSSKEHQRSGRDLIVAAVSGQNVDSPGPFDHVVAGWQEAGLIMPSVIRCAKIVTVERAMVRRALGTLDYMDLTRVLVRARKALAARLRRARR